MNSTSIYKTPKVVAEIGCNHKGDLLIAKELIQLAKSANADYAKFQKRCPKECLTEEQYNAPHPVAYQSYGETYGAHREFLEFSVEQHSELKAFSESIGIKYATSVWDITSAKEIISLSPDFIKVPSACNNHEDLLNYLINHYDGDVHVSLGMTRDDELIKILQLFENHMQRLVLYACTSNYPVKFENVCLLEIQKIKNSWGDKLSGVGFSGHHLGIAIDIAAYTLGAEWIERHFTKDRTWKGTDHAASLEPGGLQKLIRDLDATHKALAFKDQEILEAEKIQRDKLKFKK